MQTVRETVQATLNAAGYGNYASYAEPVVTALEGRERDISGVLIEFATRQGMSREAVEGALRQAGLALPTNAEWTDFSTSATTPATPAMQTADAPEQDLAAAIANMNITLASLLAFARENGYTG